MKPNRKDFQMENPTLDWDAILPKDLGLVYRSRWTELSTRYGLPFSRKTMQNLDSEGRGPAAVMVAGKVAYPRAALVAFLNSLPIEKLHKRGRKGDMRGGMKNE
jgi:hypothetical protein